MTLSKSALWSWALNRRHRRLRRMAGSGYAYGISGPPDGHSNALTVRARLGASGSFRLYPAHPSLGRVFALISPPYVYLQRLEGNSDNLTVLATGSLQGKVQVGEWFTAQLVAETVSVFISTTHWCWGNRPEDRYQQGRVGFV